MPIFSRRSSLGLDLVAEQSHSPFQSGVSSTNFHDCGSEVRGVLVLGWPQLCLAMVLREGRWVTNYVHKRGAREFWWSRQGELPRDRGLNGRIGEATCLELSL